MPRRRDSPHVGVRAMLIVAGEYTDHPVLRRAS
jgi:hypothetical protein